MIIDSHVHLKHGNVARTEFTATQIVEFMDGAGVDRSVVFAICTTTERSIAMAKEARDQYPDRIIPYAYAIPHPEQPIIPLLRDAVQNHGFKGIKLHRGEYTLAEYVVDPVLNLAGELDVPCLIDFGGNVSDLKRIAATFPQTKVIAAHLGRYLGTDAGLIDAFIDTAAEHSNIYLDISGVVLTWKIAEAVARVGKDRVLWGSDGPLAAPTFSGYIQTDIQKVRLSGLSPEEEEAVLGGTARRLLGFDGFQ